MTKAASKRIGLKTTPADMQITGLQETTTAHAVSKATVTLRSLRSNYETTLETFIIKKITNNVPAQKVDSQCCAYIDGLKLADPEFYKPQKVDMLLGVDIYAQILQEGIVRCNESPPIAQATKLGWILMGSISEEHSHQESSNFFCQNTPTLEELNENLKSFWETEEIDTLPKLKPEEQKSEDLFKSSYKRHEDGHYSVLLPFRNEEGPELGYSRSNAIAQFLQLEKKFPKNPKYHELYRSCIQEYLDLGHMREVPQQQIKDQQKIQHYYMPHHGVLKESSSTTKLRVVFNASSKTSNGKSLNEQMLIGPKIQSSLWSILMRWRNYKYAFTADIEKMYRMVSVRPEHQNYQRIIWRNNPKEPLKDYALTTVTFGTASAPFLAIRTLQQLAFDEATTYPEAAHGLLHQCYVDDINLGGFDIQETIKLQKELTTLLRKGGFNLRKWTANNAQLLEHIPEEYRELKQFLDISETDSVKTLGIKWYPAQDNFGFSVKLPQQEKPYTKRIILSEVATLFDPFGWLSPSIILGKILIQKLWLSGCSWDEKAPEGLIEDWVKLKNNLKKIEDIKIPRWTHFTPNTAYIELHGFCDASIQAYAAVIYLKICNSNFENKISICAAKTKVAPVKPITLPRLELCGAVLLSRLMKQTLSDLNLQNVKCFAWTDSLITLAWIQGQPSKWKTFVANRTAEIIENTIPSIWRYLCHRESIM